MPDTHTDTITTIQGTAGDDRIADGYVAPNGETTTNVTHANGWEGDDVIATSDGNSLAAGDMVGNEWIFVNGVWVYDQTAFQFTSYGMDLTFDDIITTGRGDDVLLGNGGDDFLYAGSGDDTVNGGRGDDTAFGGHGDDLINLEQGNDFAQAGLGDDVINAGAGDDVVYGDIKTENLLDNGSQSASTFDDLATSGGWNIVDSFGNETISQSTETVAGETYTVSFELAANLAGGHSSGAVDVIWNGAVVDTVQVTSGAYETFQIDVVSEGGTGELAFQALTPQDGLQYNFDGPIITYSKEMTIAGADTTVTAFAAGQAKLYQVIDGQLNVFDVETNAYVTIGEKPDFKINSVGFNVEDDLIYGVAKSSGFDSLGNAVNTTDIVMIDANGATYRIGDGFYGDYVGDFDDKGNLWTFHTSLNRISVVDVDQFDAQGNPVIQHFNFPNDMFTDRTFDVAYNAEDGNFYAVVSPNVNGGDGKVIKIDMSTVADGGTPTFTEVSITGTLYGDTMEAGITKGSFGAVFMDGEGNLYYGLNRGDHDLDASTGVKGAIFQVEIDWDSGQAYSVFMSEAPSTGSNDGAVDPRSINPFSDVDANAAVLIREPKLTQQDGGNDVLRGGAGNDELHGNAGNDRINGGADDDIVFGDQGNDNLHGGTGDDWISGGTGKDKLIGNAGSDELFGNNGKDYLNGGTGDDALKGGEGVDKLVGGTGSDTLEGGEGNDNLWGGNWTADGSVDTFVFTNGTDKDYIHDFEVDVDLIDLSAYDTNFADVQASMNDLGWATVLELCELDGAASGDRVVIKSVDASELTADCFIF